MNKKFNPVDNMMLNIVEEGEEFIFRNIEYIIDPLERIKQKGIYFEAIKRLKERK